MSEYIFEGVILPEGSVKGEGVLVKREEIVRCRDCVNANKVETRFSGAQYACTRFEDYTVEPDGFCAWAERRQP